MAAYVVVSGLLALYPVPRSLDLFVLSLLGVPAAILLAVAVSSRPRLAGPLGRLGRQTLPVYVLHMPVLALVAQLPAWVGPGRGPFALAAAVLYPLLLTAVIAAACLGLHAVLVRVGGRYLFEMPRARLERLRPQREPMTTVPSRLASTMISAVRPAVASRSRVVAD